MGVKTMTYGSPFVRAIRFFKEKMLLRTEQLYGCAKQALPADFIPARDKSGGRQELKGLEMLNVEC